MGWVTVAAYFFTAALAFKLYLSAGHIFFEDVVVKQKRFWLVIGLIMLFLGVNKQLDLQSFLTAFGKYYAHRDGWYQQRRVVQVAVIIGILLTISLMVAVFFYYMKVVLEDNWLAVAGLCFLLVFIIVRATSFHHMDVLINTYISGVRMNLVLELSGILCVTYSAFLILLRRAHR
ncbi:MAG: hypothetical protein ABW148_11125 [Sedimenticola sp.]